MHQEVASNKFRHEERKMKTRFFSRFLPVTAGLVIFITAGFLSGENPQKPLVEIENPYTAVDWAVYAQYKANLHTHTRAGDADATPREVVDFYRKLGYTILAITDHDDNVTPEPTWPWQAYGIEPEALGMVAIQGNEISGVNHINSYFNDYGDPDVASEKIAIEEIGRRGGIAVINHPGRYNRRVDWYVDLYRSSEHLIGLEIYNREDRYSKDRQLWDAILSELLPGRPVWGFANDDMHDPDDQIGFSWNVFILSELTTENVRHAMEQGCFFFTYAPGGHNGTPVPFIEEITVDDTSGTIHVTAKNFERIQWISRGDLVHTGNSLNLTDFSQVHTYVRIEIHGTDGITGRQDRRTPFQAYSQHRERALRSA